VLLRRSSEIEMPMSGDRGSSRPVVVIGAGQSGLAAARELRDRGVSTIVLEAGERAAGSWPYYYDSLRAFSPAGFSSMIGMPFPGDPERYPTRDEVADYLERYAAALDVEIRTNTRVVTVRQDEREFVVVTADGQELRAVGIVAASGSFSNPHRPSLAGEEGFAGSSHTSPTTATRARTPACASPSSVPATLPHRLRTSSRTWQA
jgi:putative flavoprotein involved in K+ transport